MRLGLFVVVFGFTVTLGTEAGFATETRVQTLQNMGGIQDEVQTFTYPGRLPLDRIALVELGTAQATEVYAAAFVGKARVSAGIAVSRSDWLFTKPWLGETLSLFERYQDAMTSNDNNGPQLVEPTRPVEILTAIRLGKSQALGLRMAIATKKNTEDSGEGATDREAKMYAEQFDLTAGFSSMTGQGSLDTAISANLVARQKRAEKALGVDSSTFVKGKPTVSVSARWLADRDDSGPYAEVFYWNKKFSVETKTIAEKKSSDFSETAVSAEGGYVYVVGKKEGKEIAKLFAGANLASTKSSGPTVSGTGGKTVPSYLVRSEKAEVKADLLNLALSGEANIGEGGFGALLGMRYALYGTITEKDKTSGVETKKTTTIDETSDASLWSLGIFYRQQALRVDASYGRSLLFNGPHFISGNASSPLFARLSASYDF